MTLGQGTEASLVVDLVFWVIAVSSIVAAVAVVQLRNVFRAALFLIVSFLGVAGLFVLMRAEFLAAVQIVVYVGAISILIIFAILMTRDIEEGNPSHRLSIPLAIISLLFMLVAIFVVVQTEWNLTEHYNGDLIMNQKIGNVFSNTVPWIARLLVNDFVLAFEVVSVLLLAAIVGALALVRER